MYAVLYGLMIAQWAWQIWVDAESTEEFLWAILPA